MSILAMNNKNLDDFKSNGYIIFPKIFSKKVTDVLTLEINILKNKIYETGILPDKVKFQNYNGLEKIHSQCNVWKSNSKFKKIVLNKTLGKKAASLMGWDGVRINQDTMFTVSSGFGPTTFHQDNPYQDWHTSDGVITAIIALKKITKPMGCLIFIPKSHKWQSNNNRLTTDFIGSADPLRDLNNSIQDNKIKVIAKKYIEMEAGDVSFHHGNLWHGSGLNKSNIDRETLSIHFMQHDAKFSAKIRNPWFSRYQLNGTTEMNESFFPITWKKNR